MILENCQTGEVGKIKILGGVTGSTEGDIFRGLLLFPNYFFEQLKKLSVNL